MRHEQRQARSFGAVAEAYDRGRPDYPAAAVEWLLGERPCRVLELGAGTGKLTRALVAAGHEVHATDPDEAMLDVLRRHLPHVRTSVAAAEALPVEDQSFDVVVAAQAAHWFGPEAWGEAARVLVDGGVLATVWNTRDERIPWVRKLGRILGGAGDRQTTASAVEAVPASGWFGELEQADFGHWQQVDRRTIQDLAASRSHVATRDEAGREAVVADVLALYDDYGRGMDGMQLPYRTQCFRAVVVARPEPEPDPEPEPVAEVEDDATPAVGHGDAGTDAGTDASTDDGTDAGTPGAQGGPARPRAGEPEPTVPLAGLLGGAAPAAAPTTAAGSATALAEPLPPIDPIHDSAATLPRVVTGLDDDAALVLIDFR